MINCDNDDLNSYNLKSTKILIPYDQNSFNWWKANETK